MGYIFCSNSISIENLPSKLSLFPNRFDRSSPYHHCPIPRHYCSSIHLSLEDILEMLNREKMSD